MCARLPFSRLRFQDNPEGCDADSALCHPRLLDAKDIFGGEIWPKLVHLDVLNNSIIVRLCKDASILINNQAG